MKDKERKNVMVRMSRNQTDSRIYQGRLTRNLGRIENKLDHLTTMTEGEAQKWLCSCSNGFERSKI